MIKQLNTKETVSRECNSNSCSITFSTVYSSYSTEGMWTHSPPIKSIHSCMANDLKTYNAVHEHTLTNAYWKLICLEVILI